MKGLLNPNGPLMRFLSRVFDLMVLNLIFLLCCIPIVTIGPSYAAMQKTTQNMIYGTGEGFLTSFLEAFKNNLKQSIVVWLVVLVLIVAWVLNLFLIISYFSGNLATVCYVVAAITAVIIVAVLSYCFPLMVRYNDSIAQILLNAVILSGAKFRNTVLLLVLAALPLFMMYFPLDTILPYWILGGFSIYSYCVSVIMKPIFSELESPKIEQGKENCHGN